MSARRWLPLLAAALLASTVRADVTYDSSSTADAPLHAGSTWLIEESHGVQRGGNLFHGFGTFDLAPGETAYFRPTFPVLRDPGLPPIEHVIARVSGGAPSSIRGTIQSGYGVDFYLLNPAGVIFGQGAKLDLRGGAFVASTANVLRLGSERVEVPLAGSEPFPLLAVGAPSSFGFLSAPPATIRVADTRLINPSSTAFGLALFGGELQLERALLSAPASDLYLSAVSSGEIGIAPSGFDLSGVQGTGSIALQTSVLSTSGIDPGGTVKTSGAGDLFIRGGDLLGIDASISAHTVGQDPGGDIDIVLDGDLQMERRAIQGAGIFAFSQFDPDRLYPPGTGSSGNIHVQARDVTLLGGARISTGALGDGAAGGIVIDASGQVRISGRDVGTLDPDESGLVVSTAGGPSGSIAVTARDLVMDDFGVIVGETRSASDGGRIDIGVDRLDIRGNARIDSSSRGSGNGGNIEVRASESVQISGSESATEFSGITAFAQPESTGDAGSIRVETPSLTLAAGGQISTAGLGPQSNGGNIEVQTSERVELENSRISTNVSGGTGGNIRIDPEFVILRNGQIVAQAGKGTGGSIDISAGLFVADVNSLVSASSESGIDGTVVIHSPEVDLSDELAALPDEFVDPANLLADRCAARESGARGSLTLREFDALPDWPGRLRPSRYALQLARSADPGLQEIWGAARAAEQRGDDALALERWDRAAALASTPLLRGAAKLGSAQALERSGRSGRALGRIDEALAAAGPEGPIAAAAHALRGRIRSDPAELERALTLTSDSELLARIHADLGAVQQLAGEREAALRSYAQAERFAKQAGLVEAGFALRANRATLYVESGDAQRARSELAAARAELSRAADDHDAAFAALHTILDELVLEPAESAALEPLDRIAESAARRGDARAGSFARAFRAHVLARGGQTARAVDAAREALLLAQRARAPEAELVADRLLGRELAALGQGDAAVRELERAYAIRAGRFAGIADPATASAAHAGWFATAPLLDELVDQLLRLAAATEDPAEHERLLLAARDHLDDGTALALREYFADECVAAQRVVSAAALPGAVVVYPALLPDRVELIVSSPRGTRAILVDALPAQILAEARSLTELSQQRTSRRYRVPAARLYDWLVRPLEGELGGDDERTLVVVPRGALLRVPWAALWDTRRGSHLIEHYPLAIVPGLSLAESRPVSGDVRALKAGVSEGVQGLPALPAVTRELGEVSSFYAGPTLLDAGFSTAELETALRSDSYGVVHIASHASFGASADDAYVVTWDGRLGARQLADLVGLTRFRDRPLELLTLSACDTSVGDERAALGLAGLAVRAGARSTLGTLWPVNDEAAADLVGNFYRELARPGGSRAEALRRAQLAALADPSLAHPAYWSPFVMIGSWQ